jgi:hypothetical protein
MSPAGAGAARFREANTACSGFACAGLLVTAFVVLLLMLSGGSAAHASPAPVAALSPAWTEFQRDCVAGPSPGIANRSVGDGAGVRLGLLARASRTSSTQSRHARIS